MHEKLPFPYTEIVYIIQKHVLSTYSVPVRVLGHWDIPMKRREKILTLRGPSFLFLRLVIKNLVKSHQPHLLQQMLFEENNVLQGSETCYFGGNLIFCVLRIGLMNDEDHGLVLSIKDK